MAQRGGIQTLSVRFAPEFPRIETLVGGKRTIYNQWIYNQYDSVVRPLNSHSIRTA